MIRPKAILAAAMALRMASVAFLLVFAFCVFFVTLAHAASCEKVVRHLHAGLSASIDERELVEILRTLNDTGNKKLPGKFMSKKEARSYGWKPGKDLWSAKILRGASIGGDRFGNYERRLPVKQWREADLDYKGGRRGSKRLVFSTDGQRMITVDHYATFTEVPPCR